MAEKQYTLEQIKEAQEIAAALGMSAGEKNDVFSTTLTNQSLYNVNPGNTSQLGVFTGVGIRPGMWNATARVRTFANIVPFNRSVYTNEMLEIMTGVTAGTGNNSTSSCAAAPTPGVLKTMRQAYTFGIINMDTTRFDMTGEGARYNRAVVDRDMYNTAMMNNPFIPALPGIEGTDITSNNLRAAMYTLGIEIERSVSTVNFTGVAATEDNAFRGVARQWAGLDALIKTGYADSQTGAVAPVVDSDVQSFNANVVGGTDANSRDIVGALNDLVYGLRERASQVASTVPTHVAIMRPDLFRQLSRIWAEADAFYHVTGAAATPVYATGSELQDARRAMQRGQYIILDDGSQLPVVLDDSLPRDVLGNNYYKSDIYVPALEWGGVPLLQYEYFPMDNPDAEAVASMGTPGHSMVINGGLYRLFRFETGGCINWKVYGKVRMILDAPFVSGRLDDVWYNSYYKQQDPLPGMSFHSNGGNSYRLSQ